MHLLVSKRMKQRVQGVNVDNEDDEDDRFVFFPGDEDVDEPY